MNGMVEILVAKTGYLHEIGVTISVDVQGEETTRVLQRRDLLGGGAFYERGEERGSGETEKRADLACGPMG
jgi:hypothetical protein